MEPNVPKKRRMPRLLWELLIFLFLAGLAYGGWRWQEYQHDQSLASEVEGIRAEQTALREQLDARLSEAVATEASAVARAFAAGIAPLVLARDWNSVDGSMLELLALQEVAFVHLLGSDGGVLVSSDRKLTAMGEVGTRAGWVLETRDVAEKLDVPGRVEIAVALKAADDEAVAHLWLGYATSREPRTP